METIFDFTAEFDERIDDGIEKKRWKSLTNQLAKYQKAYDDGAPLIDDDTYDDLLLQLQALENKYGILPNSPSVTTGYNTDVESIEMNVGANNIMREKYVESSKNETSIKDNNTDDTIQEKHVKPIKQKTSVKDNINIMEQANLATEEMIDAAHDNPHMQSIKKRTKSTKKTQLAAADTISSLTNTDVTHTSNQRTKMENIVHVQKMLSLDQYKVLNMSTEEMEKGITSFMQKINRFLGTDTFYTLICEPKVDGVSLSLRYENGKLVTAALRGNGVEGENVLENIIHLNLPQKINIQQTIEVRGELFMSKTTYQMLQEKGIIFASPRHAVSGSVRLLDPAIFAERGIQFVVHGIAMDNYNYPFDTYDALMTWLESQHFPTFHTLLQSKRQTEHKSNELANQQNIISVASYQQDDSEITSDTESKVADNNVLSDELSQNKGPIATSHTYTTRADTISEQSLVYFHATVVNSLSEAVEYFTNINTIRESLDYNIDGVVYKLNNIQLYQTLLYSHKYPRYAFAIKFPSKSKTSTITGIRWQIGRTGAITPVIEIESVHIDGSNISNITMHNVSEFERYRPVIGDIAVIEKAGDVIPAIIDVIHMQTIENESIMLDEIETCANVEINDQCAEQMRDIFTQIDHENTHQNDVKDKTITRAKTLERQEHDTDASLIMNIIQDQNQQQETLEQQKYTIDTSLATTTQHQHQQQEIHIKDSDIIIQQNHLTRSVSMQNSSNISISASQHLRSEQSIHIPEQCPSCHSTLIRDSKVLLCLNNDCRGKLIAQLIYAYSRDCLNIEGLADQKIIFLFDQGLLKYPVDIFTLSEACIRKQITLEKLPNWGRISTNNLYKQIEKAKNITFDRFLLMLGIEYLGKRMSEKLANICSTWDELIQYLSNETQIGLGTHIKTNILQYHETNGTTILEFLKHIKIIQSEKITYKDIRVVFTGKFQVSRQAMKEKAQQHGVQVFDSVAKNTTYVIYGDDAGSKLKQARAYELKCLTYDEWQRALVDI